MEEKPIRLTLWRFLKANATATTDRRLLRLLDRGTLDRRMVEVASHAEERIRALGLMSSLESAASPAQEEAPCQQSLKINASDGCPLRGTHKRRSSGRWLPEGETARHGGNSPSPPRQHISHDSPHYMPFLCQANPYTNVGM